MPRQPSTLVRGRAVPITLAVVALLVLTALVAFRWGSAASSPGPDAASPTASDDTGDGTLTVAEVYATLAPSVVSIAATRTVGAGGGTGVIINADGTILTALHVVRDAGAIQVTFADGTRAAATVGDTDPANDIATLTPAALPTVVVPAVLGGGVSIGDEVVAIGNQLGLTGSTTAGVVSGLGRSASSDGTEDLNGLIQFDAAVNPGSSGGPLVNVSGATVGIVVALANPTEAGTFIGVGFAVPIGVALGAGANAPQI
ncbi:trypsin-like peptidase domain-containing protein [Solwaraspora sp. WMMD1047]|uniref:S1C family serine protease n=1 Tax=Solwaraspora sp. WMMD1047 TaxID=3016102 RepID=UPI002415ABD4|nr:trypsin-like peptidase domain-containing protein [Solwaraspora sp. WMMD1047]MDG4830992.1 trypsin-like peptidase domain-containing protein [Solwaraspora sp. WMMD1047]